MFSRRRAVQPLLTERHSDVHRHIKCFVFTLFGFTLFFVSCHFSCFELWSVQRDNLVKKNSLLGARLNHVRRRGPSQPVSFSLSGIFTLCCLMNQLLCWQIWQILKLVLRPAVCMLGLMYQRVELQSPPCSPTGIQYSLRANIFRHFPWQPATISALSTTVGDGMIAKWPNKTFFSQKTR